ncbi:MAG: hypothetical protein WDO24_09075 [Pseudomonadota bacterium]
MIFTSQSGLTDTSRSAAWDAWYLGHLDAMAAVPGIGSAQRFAALDPGPPPSLAMYSIASPAVFESEIYLRTRGMGPWKPLIDPNHYRRNLFDGLDTAPEIAPPGILLVVDRAAPEPTGRGLVWLRAVGLDRSTPFRGLAVLADLPAARALAATISGSVALYQPVTRRYGAP